MAERRIGRWSPVTFRFMPINISNKRINQKDAKMDNIKIEDIAVLYSPKQGVFHTETLAQSMLINTRTYIENKKSNDFILLGIVKTEEEAADVIEELKVLWGKCNDKSCYKTNIEIWLEKQMNS
jgi:hypothetical protein